MNAKKSRARLEVEAGAAALVSSLLVAGLLVLCMRFGLLNNSTESRLVVVVLGSMVGVIVWATYLKNRGVDS